MMPDDRTTRATRYVIEHDDGRLLSIGYAGSKPIALWTDRPDGAWSWDTYTQATMVALRLVPDSLDWRVRAI